MGNKQLIKKIYWAVWAIIAALHMFGILHFLNANVVLNFFGLNINDLGYQITMGLLILGAAWFIGLIIISIIAIIFNKITKSAYEPDKIINYTKPFSLRINNFLYNTGLLFNKLLITLFAALIIGPTMLALNILKFGAENQYQTTFLLVLIYCLIEIIVPLRYLERFNNVNKFKNRTL